MIDEAGDIHPFRRIQVKLDQPTRDGDRIIYILTNLPRKVASAKTVARLYRKRWTLETVFEQLEGHLHSFTNLWYGLHFCL